MVKLSAKQQKIVSIFLEKVAMSSSEVHAKMAKLADGLSLVTVKRALSEMTGLGIWSG